MRAFSHIKYSLILYFTVLFVAVCATLHASESSALNLVILFRDDMAVHNKLVQSVRELLASDKDIVVGIVPIRSFVGTLDRADFVLAVGDSALASAMKSEDVRGIFLLVTDSRLADRAVSSGRWQGALARPSYGLQMNAMRSVLPHVASLGLIYGSESEYELNLLQKAAADAGIVIKARQVQEASSALSGIRFLFDSAHAVFMFPDARLLNNITMESMLLLQHEKRIPVIGISRTSVVAGALMAVSYDLDTLPVVVADAVKGYKTSSVIPTEDVFRKAVTVYYNANVAERLGLRLNVNKLDLRAVVVK